MKSIGGWASEQQVDIAYTLLITIFQEMGPIVLPVGEAVTSMEREKPRMSLVVLVRISVVAVHS